MEDWQHIILIERYLDELDMQSPTSDITSDLDKLPYRWLDFLVSINKGRLYENYLGTNGCCSGRDEISRTSYLQDSE